MFSKAMNKNVGIKIEKKKPFELQSSIHESIIIT